MTTTARCHAAERWYATGALPLPVAPDGSKRPSMHSWRGLQDPTKRPDADTVTHWFNTIDSDGIGVVCGAASGNLEMLEAEGVAVADGILEALQAAFAAGGAQRLWERVTGGYVELTPSGGIHWYYRVDGPIGGNTKLARRPATEAELAEQPGNRIRVLIETRGEGGWSVVAPSSGRSHPSGKAWMSIVGTPADIPIITEAERDTIHAICASLDRMPTQPAPAVPTTHAGPTRYRPSDGQLRPGDDFNARASWDDILIPHGWQPVQGQPGGTRGWVRPGKARGQGISATTGHSDDGQDRLYVFSSSTNFEQEVPYTKFGAYALLNCAGDHARAALELGARGYGAPYEEPKLRILPSPAVSEPGHRRPETDGSSALAPVIELDQLDTDEMTEDALARAFVTEVMHELKFCPQRRQWLTWDGARWCWDEGEQHREHIKQVARRLARTPKQAATFRRKMLSSNGVSSIANLARTDPRIVVHLDALDAQPYELNTPGGVVDLRTGRLHPPDPSRLHTRSTAVTPDFDTGAPRWEAFLQDTFGGDDALIGYLQRLMGLATIGTVLEQIMPFGYGVGANGKSVFIEACTDVLGRGERGYAIAVQAEMLMARRFQEHATEIAQLAGARLVVCSELEDGASFAEARIKQLTGRDSISARFMKRDFFTFTPSHTFLLVANHKPRAAVGGPAFWRRLRLIPFNHVVPVERRDSHLPEKLRDEWPAILAWIIRGAVDYIHAGMRTPESITVATQAYQQDEDSIGRFVSEQCKLAPGQDQARVQVSVLRAAYEQACRETGDEPVSPRRLTQELRDRFGIESDRTHGRRLYVGVMLPTDDEGDPREPSESPELGLL